MIPYGRQFIDDDDIAAVVAALKSDFLTCGPEVEAFEREFAEFIGARHAVAVSNATAALHLAMLVADVGSKDRVVTSTNTFLASANCAAFVGATPDFCDIDPVSLNLCPNTLEANWKEDTKAVVAVDYAGQPANMPAIAKLARERGAVVIEDGCHGVGGGFYYDNKFWKIGGHPWADMTTFSFHPVKTMTTGEGGMLVTNDDEYARRARLLRSHGMERNANRFTTFEAAPWIYEMQELGYNYRITDIQCALGRRQLKKLPEFINRRRAIVSRYNEAFGMLDWLQIPSLIENTSTSGFITDSNSVSWHLYTVRIDFEKIGKTRVEVMDQLRGAGVGSQVLYIPVHLQPWYQKTYGYTSGKCPVAEANYKRVLSLPLFPAMDDNEVAHVIQQVQTLGDA